jgi:hypothetical protein
MKKMLVAVSLIVVAVASGCGKDGAAVAKVNGTKITVADFKRQVEELPPQMQQAVMSSVEARKDFLADLVGIEVVIQEARRQGLHKDAEYKKRQETRKKELERAIREEAKNDLFNALLKKELADKMGKLSVPSDQQVRDYYNKHKNAMRTADGKQVGFKEAEPQLRSRMMQEKQRAVYMEYATALKAKAKITVDDKALDALGGQPADAGAGGLQLQHPPMQNTGNK